MQYLSDEEKTQHREIKLSLIGKLGARYGELEASHPNLDCCPTCNNRGRYVLYGETYECDCSFQKLLRIHYLAADLPPEYHSLCLEHFTGAGAEVVVPIVQKYLDEYESNLHYGTGITFYGQSYGTGKTFAMSCILKELIKQGRNVKFVTFEEMFNTWAVTWKDDAAKRELEERMMRAEVLGIDEVKSDPRNQSGFLANGFASIIGYRSSHLLPTLVTTNMTEEQQEREFPRVFSLLSLKNLKLPFAGQDQRKNWVHLQEKELREAGEVRPVC